MSRNAGLWLMSGSLVALLMFVPVPGSAQDDGGPSADVSVPQSSEADEQRAAARLLTAIDDILNEAAEQRHDARRLPSEDDFLVSPLWRETREERQRKIRKLLDAALDLVTDVPLVEMQEELEVRRRNIRDLKDRIAALREKRLTAPEDALLPGLLTDTVASLDDKIADLEKRIAANRQGIGEGKQAIRAALARSGVEISPEQLDLLLDSVLSGDLIRLVATFEAAKLIDGQLNKLVAASDGNLSAARKYFAMHAALFAMLVHAQDSAIEKIDHVYMPRLESIVRRIEATTADTKRLLAARNRPDQRRALQANLKSQAFAKRVASYYSGYLLQQREHLAKARLRAVRDLEVADNTYETVEVSFQLRALIKDASASFDAIQKLEAPGFEQIFKNQELRREFENLTRKLVPPSS